MKNKLERLNHSLKKAIAGIFLKEYPQYSNLEVTDALIDSSFRNVRIFLRTDSQTLQKINKDRHNIQKQLDGYVKLRFTPKLTFITDDDYLEKIDHLIEQIHNEN